MHSRAIGVIIWLFENYGASSVVPEISKNGSMGISGGHMGSCKDDIRGDGYIAKHLCNLSQHPQVTERHRNRG